VLFPTIQFGIFFPIVFVASWLLRPHARAWKLFMLGASYFFLCSWQNWHHAVLMASLLGGATVANQVFVEGIDRSQSQGARKAWVMVAVAANLTCLGFFKYYNFFIQTALNLHAHVPPRYLVRIILPIGISFFLFQAMSYVIDAYRDNLKPVSLLDFAVYLSFFPHLVAGPIVRATEFLPQLKHRPDPRYLDAARAFRLIVAGMFKKVVISAYLATTVDAVFAAPGRFHSLEVLFGVYAYAFQIYADFSGYTDIAIGLALLLGIKFPVNFNSPYTSTSLGEFWRRWHMSLSRWLRDYLYISLGGNRVSVSRTYVNLMLTMVIGGLWHGAAWRFVIWGGIHGVVLAIERLLDDRREAIGLGPRPDTPFHRFLQWAVTFHVVCFAWIFFRAPSTSRAFEVIKQIFLSPGVGSLVTPLLVVTILALLASQFVPEGVMENVQVAFSRVPILAQGVALAACFFLIDHLSPAGVQPFIYFQF
jgi:D-alanyl-lipoteichoic acid acyltransferase DltB (MBOAT superfamily)